jgi:hypothetical protein
VYADDDASRALSVNGYAARNAIRHSLFRRRCLRVRRDSKNSAAKDKGQNEREAREATHKSNPTASTYEEV